MQLDFIEVRLNFLVHKAVLLNSRCIGTILLLHCRAYRICNFICCCSCYDCCCYGMCSAFCTYLSSLSIIYSIENRN